MLYKQRVAHSKNVDVSADGRLKPLSKNVTRDVVTMYGMRSILNPGSQLSAHSIKYQQRLVVRGLAGHSHFHNIKHRKAAVDAKRQTQFQKLSNDIRGAVVTGGNDPSSNPRLARAIEVAKKAGVPNKRIENALLPTDSAASMNTPTAIYYGILPHAVAVRVTALQTRQRAIAAELRSIFRRAGGDLEKGEWQFKDKHSVLIVLGGGGAEGVDKGDAALLESMTLVAMECDVTDVTEDSKNTLRLTCTSAKHSSTVAEALKKKFPNLEKYFTSAHSVEPVSSVTMQEDSRRKDFEILIEKLNAHRDVTEVIHNVKL